MANSKTRVLLSSVNHALNIALLRFACTPRRYHTRHTLCLPKTCKTVDSGLKNGEEQEILYAHNRYRAQVATATTQYPALAEASDMLLLEWDDDLAATAQAHADLCRFDHDCPSCRRIGKFDSNMTCGLFRRNKDGSTRNSVGLGNMVSNITKKE